MNLSHYFKRIGYIGPVEPTLECLSGIHHCHALTVPYENLDIQMGLHVDLDKERIFKKIVGRRRGGWCYEQHVLFLWVLEKIGFDAKLVTSAVERKEHGDSMIGNHTSILVALDQTYLADLGLGDGIRFPIPFYEGIYIQGPLTFQLIKIDGYWRFLNHAFSSPRDFDLTEKAADYELLTRKSHELQSSPDSEFVQNLVCQIMREASVTCLTGRVLRHKTADGQTKKLINEDQFESTLYEIFGISDPNAASIWPKVAARHRLLFGDQTIEDIDYQGF
ncbi:MAG: N-hydroxyarylamine O-acetyltransferase [Gammaproteobacteria bacterium]|jgi:N-hydroxyarylamine O-acetyltransferase